MITIPEFANAHLTNHNNIINKFGNLVMDVGINIEHDVFYRSCEIVNNI